MTFRLHSTVAVLLFPAILLAQTSSPAARPQSSKPAPASTGGPYAPMSKAAKQRGEQVFQMFNDGQTGALWAAFGETMKKNYGSEAKFVAQTKGLRERLGTEKKVIDETLVPMLLSVGTVYARLSDFSKVNVEVITNIAIDERGQVDAFQVGPAQTPSLGRFGGYKDKTKLKLPFSGEWLVDQGGRTAYQNQNLMSDDQRFSLDFVLLKGGRPFSGDGSNNSDYYCFGQPVLAPADGLVVEVEDGYQDNSPGRPSTDSPRGNMVLVSHGNSEFSLVDHLKQNSIKVKKGDKVKQGDALAECGNSGPSPAPHIHYQLQNSAGIPWPDSLPVQFVGYVADGKPVDVGELVRGQMVSNAPPGATSPASTGQPGSKTPPGTK